MTQSKQVLEATRIFGDQNPCDGHDNLFQRMVFRYKKDPFLIPLLTRISGYHRILEIGCGQGTDAIYVSRHDHQDRLYVGLDLSIESLQNATTAINQDTGRLHKSPRFLVANAESLPFPDDYFDCIYSGGVLHHTPNIRLALREVLRVLKPGGDLFITLYRTLSPKIFTAHFIRSATNAIEFIIKKPHFFINKFGNIGAESFWGTMIQECLGVPILNSYSKYQVLSLFSNFENIHVRSVSAGFPLPA